MSAAKASEEIFFQQNKEHDPRLLLMLATWVSDVGDVADVGLVLLLTVCRSLQRLQFLIASLSPAVVVRGSWRHPV